MRLSSALFAFLTVSATLGLANPTQAQTVVASEPQPSEAEALQEPEIVLEQRVLSPVASGTLPAVWQLSAAIAPQPPERSQPELYAQEANDEPSVIIEPAPGLPGEPPPPNPTPNEGTQEEIELLDIPLDAPNGDIEVPEDVIEGTPPDTPPATAPEPPPETQAEPRVLVSEVVVEGVEGELQALVYDSILTTPGRTTTRTQLQEDRLAIFSTGFFSNVEVIPSDTPLGVRVTFVVVPNPVLSNVQLRNSALETLTVDEEVVPVQTAVDRIFAPQYGEILNFRDLQIGIQQLNALYQENGYVLAQVIDAPEVSPDGVVTLEVAEGVIENLRVVFLDEEGNTEDEDGEPIEGQTREFIITREFESQPGDVFNQGQIQADLQRLFDLGIFEDVRVTLNPGEDPRQVDVVVNVIERNTGSLAAGLGFSSASGLFGTVSFQEQNLGGNNQRLSAEVQANFRDFLFDVSFTDPWIAGDPYRTSYTVNAFSRRSISTIFDGGDPEVDLPNNDRPRVQRIGGGVSFSRPLDEWLGWDNWRASLGLQYQNVSIRDADGDISPVDEFGNELAFNEDGSDDLLTLQLNTFEDLRNSRITPTDGSFLRLSTEQSIPIGGILFNRLRASYSYYVPVQFLDFTEGCRGDDPTPAECPQTLAFNIQGGTVLGDLPPYEAFALGGTDSVRGYDFGELGSGRSFVQFTAEYRFPIISILGGALFFDFGTDLGTGEDVPGEPAEIRDKPGTGFGYGLGIRVQSPLGQIRVDYGINDEGDGELHFGIGERF